MASLWQKVRKGLIRLLWVAAAGVVLVAIAGTVTYFYLSRDLPSVDELKKYRPPQVTKVFCRGATLCAEYYKERRTWVDVKTLPAHVKNAFLAAEDADFYSHEGLDFWGILRASVKNLIPGSQKSGASTISQQACRGLLLSRERSLSRKLREWILTPRMEKALTKDEILNLYINTIYFGHQRYGIEEAAQYYFGKAAKDLTLAEAAVLGGTPQLPHVINPVSNIVRAKKRQRYVLTQLARHNFVPKALIEPEMEKPIVLGPRPPPQVGGHYVEDIRKQLVARYGEQRVMEGGLRVEIAMDARLQAYAEAAVKSGLEALDRRQGYRGALGELDLARFEALKPLLTQRVTEAGKRRPDDVLVADLGPLRGMKVSEAADDVDPHAEQGEPAVDPEQPMLTPDEALVRGIPVRAASEGLDIVGLVTELNEAKGTAVVDFVTQKAQLDLAAHGWARPRDAAGKLGPAPTKISALVKVGQLVRVRLGKALPASRMLEAKLSQVPAVQGGLVVIDPVDRAVVAMVGGYDFNTSAFNRATQAKRQPGSSFKPFLYGAAVADGRYTTLSIVNDAPEMIRDPFTGKEWTPKNYENGFEGPVTLRQALTRSKNTVSVRLIQALTPQVVIDFAHKAGIHSELPDTLTLALGTGEITMLEEANAYATVHSLGKYSEPITLIKVSDINGTVIEEHHAAFEQVLPPAVMYLTTSMMRSVVEEGTATAVRELNRPAAGKTGTTQEHRDAWFSGYTVDYVATAWAGFDAPAPLGPGETGGKAALPIWLEFMRQAHRDLPVRDFEVPPGISLVRIDPVTGLLAGKAVPGRMEPFLDGTAPRNEAPAPGQIDPNDFLLHDGRRGG